ncbi:hypothetical protein [Bradyrhizobium sp. NAS80.1]|uniref:hypothetical protein n=1 Tax=Bradyrhizobium sp. NAS80.1 TaxID=1680159 RepID=UPI0011614E4C|nr:hypothetical protein [Bradyrhizobium sp. NAS80.1]
MMSPDRMRGLAKRLRRVLRGLGVELKHTECLDLAARLVGFNGWYDYLKRDLDASLSPLDDSLSEEVFAARDAFQISVLLSAGLGEVARELLDRANPTGSWAQQSATTPRVERVGGNDPGRWSENLSARAED